ncbi:MAG: hypothetical protein LC109_01155 [Bacteroidia bacterium]|nr:hypothetical protein [Bacteroidia bacterium]
MSKEKSKNESTATPTTTVLGAKEQNTQPTITGALTPEQEQELKKQYGRVRKIKVKLKDGSVSACYCKYPDRNVVALALSKRGQNKVLEAGETILDNCFVGGDEQCKSVDAMRISASMECYELLDFLEASSEEL